MDLAFGHLSVYAYTIRVLKIRDSLFLTGEMWQLLASKISKNGPSGNRTRVLGFEAQEDVLYPMDPAIIRMRTVGGTAF